MAEDALIDSVAGLVLAAGVSERFGSDKRQAYLSADRQLLSATLAVPCAVLSDVYVVLRADDQIGRLNLPDKIAPIHCQQAALGMGHSLACGIEWLLNYSNAAAVAVFLGDMPWLREHTLRHLLKEASESHIVLPFYAGQRGHPVIFGRNFWSELAQIKGDTGGRDVIKRHPEVLQIVELDDVGLITDVDTPHALLDPPVDLKCR
ncbi:nucleotidyltransferase family protein [Pseudomonas sp. SIMBA_077]